MIETDNQIEKPHDTSITRNKNAKENVPGDTINCQKIHS